jgi:hypothetical protein
MKFNKQPKTREEQLLVLREYLENEFKQIYPTVESLHNPNMAAPDPYEHAKIIYVNNYLPKYVRTTDNSIMGFKVRCATNFK